MRVNKLLDATIAASNTRIISKNINLVGYHKELNLKYVERVKSNLSIHLDSSSVMQLIKRSYFLSFEHHSSGSKPNKGTFQNCH